MLITGYTEFNLNTNLFESGAVIYQKIGDGDFEPLITVPLVFLHKSRGSQLVDVNDDGHADVYLQGNSSNSEQSPNIISYIILNNGDNTWNFNSPQILEGRYDGAAVFADLDNDGDKDIIRSGVDNNGVTHTSLEENDGSGNFTTAMTFPLGLVQGVITLGNFYNDPASPDNLLDFIISGENGVDRYLQMWRNQGGLNFTLVSNPVFSDNGIDSSIHIKGDFNNDGHLDIIIGGVPNSLEPSLKKYLGNGLGVFTSDPGFSLPTLFGGVITGIYSGVGAPYDFDGDGDDDFALFAETNVGRIGYLYENHGGGNFTVKDELLQLRDGDAQWVDLNNDGVKDLVAIGDLGMLPLSDPQFMAWTNSHQLGINENSLDDLAVYPNPVIGRLTIESQVPIELVEVYNMLGQKVISVSGVVDSVNFEGLSPNMYLVHIKSEDGNTTVKKVIKQ
ncbi:MAG: hypothetical protein ACJATX_000250 [Candidatus Paceibacteria bacterium]|jgi:hypothetical protein